MKLDLPNTIAECETVIKYLGSYIEMFARQAIAADEFASLDARLGFYENQVQYCKHAIGAINQICADMRRRIAMIERQNECQAKTSNVPHS